MACSSCHKKKSVTASVDPVLNASDLTVVSGGAVRPFEASDWPEDKHKLLLFYPETYTPVCGSELGTLNQWLPAFAELNCVVIAATADPAEAVREWYEQEPLLSDLQAPTFSSYLLPARLGLVEGGRAKRAGVFVTADGLLIKQECFPQVGRSFEELHRTLWAYTTGEYCGTGWTSPADGFLTPPVVGNV